MRLLSEKRKGVAALFVAVALLCGALVLIGLGQDTRAPNQVEADDKRDLLKKLNKERFFAALRAKMYDDALEKIRDARLVDVYALLGISERSIAEAETDDEYNAQDSSASFASIHALIMQAHQKSSDIKSNDLTYALDELDKNIDCFALEDAVLSHYTAVLLRSLRDEYPIALQHAQALVDMFPNSAKVYEIRAECWEGMDKDFRNLRGHFERIGINIGDWRIDDGKKMAMNDWTSAIEIQDTLRRRIKRARLEAELFRFSECWEDMKTAESMASTDKDREWIRLSIWSLKEMEKEAKGLVVS